MGRGRLQFPPLIFNVVFEFRGIGGNFLVGDAGIEASMDSIFLDFADDAFVGLIFLVFPAIGADLKATSRWSLIVVVFFRHRSPSLWMDLLN